MSHTFSQRRSRRAQRLLGLLASALVLDGCQAPGGTAAGPLVPAALTVELKGERQLLWVPTHLMTRIEAEVTGAGLSGWLPLAPLAGSSPSFGAMAADGLRLATITAKVPAGDRRVFRVKVYGNESGSERLFEELWGVADLPAIDGVTTTYPVNIRPMTTPTGKIFHELIQVDAAKALTVPIPNVQSFVQELLNTNSVTGGPQNPALAQVSPAVLDPKMAAAAIVRGNSGLPFQIPVPIPNALLEPDPARPLQRTLATGMRLRGQVKLRVEDFWGRPSTRGVSFYLSDPASRVQKAGPNAPADVTLTDVAPGTWRFITDDVERGRSYGSNVTVAAGDQKSARHVLEPKLESVTGAVAKASDSYVRQDVPLALFGFGSTGGFTVRGGRFYFVDPVAERVRSFSPFEPSPLVESVAGTGASGSTGDGGPAKAAKLNLGSGNDVVFDRDGRLFVSQADDRVRFVDTDGVIRTFWAPGYSGLADLAYDAARHQLYVGFGPKVYRLDLTTFDGSDAALKWDAAAPGANGIHQVPVSYNGGASELAVAGDYVFAVSQAGGYCRVERYHQTSGQVVPVVGSTPTSLPGSDTDANVAQVQAINSLVFDRAGEVMLFRATGGLYRVLGTTAPAGPFKIRRVLSDASVSRVVIDRDTDTPYVLADDADRNGWGAETGVNVLRKMLP